MIIIFFILLITLLSINYFFLKKNILIDKSISHQDAHKNLVNIKNNKVPLSGGFFFLIGLSFLILFSDPILFLLFFLIYSVGLLSDTHHITSPKIRIFFQIFIILTLVLYSGNSIKDIRIAIFDYLLNYQLISITFTVFCILILINGSNLIDGVNTLLCGYILLVLLFVVYVSFKNFLILDKTFIEYFILILLVFFIFNFLNKSFFGDSGAYLTSAFLGFILLLFFSKNNQISPYFIVVLLWYPAFENLFSILKRLFLKKKSYLPDNTHLHHNIFLFISNKINLTKNKLSTITGMLINFYNFFIFLLASQNIYSTKLQVNIILFNVFFYLFIYYFLFRNIKKNNTLRQ
jgi:UDP-N-acetylmuramyl pentapeptide phosphotransferase/UDP-N-acetylglucosamine-1-phosphate transferase